jgi:hypothetical protein
MHIGLTMKVPAQSRGNNRFVVVLVLVVAVVVVVVVADVDSENNGEYNDDDEEHPYQQHPKITIMARSRGSRGCTTFRSFLIG